jgi:tetratricopeptide (TPR) repeat protein
MIEAGLDVLSGRRPTVAVLPFACGDQEALSPDFGVGFSLALSNALMRIPGLRVVSALSSTRVPFAADGSGEPPEQLSARYLVVGTIEQHDQILHVGVQLRDMESAKQVLIRQIDIHLGHLQSFHQDVVPRVVAVILPELREAEITRALAKQPGDSTAYEKLLQAIVAMHRQTRTEHDRAQALLEEAVRIDPHYADAYAWHARLLSIRLGQGWAADRAAVCHEALERAQHALCLDPENALALAIAGHLHSYLHKRYDKGLELLEKAVVTCPNEPMAWLLYGNSLAYVGRAAEGRRMAEYALSLSPLDPFAYMYHCFLGTCCYMAGDFEAAARHARLSAAENPNFSATYKLLAMSLVALGDVVGARKAGARVLELEPTYATTAATTLPFADAAERELGLRRLRSAGVLPPEFKR